MILNVFLLIVLFFAPFVIWGQNNPWHLTSSNGSETECTSIKRLPNNRIVVSGTFKDSVTIGGLRLSHDSVTNKKSSFLIFLNLEGRLLNSVAFFCQNREDITIKKMETDPLGNVYLFFELKSAYVFPDSSLIVRRPSDKTAVILKYDALGKLIYAVQPESSGAKMDAKGFTVLPDGSIILGTNLKEFLTINNTLYRPVGGEDLLLIKINPKGKISKVQRFGGPNSEKIEGMGSDRAGNILIGGNFAGSLPLSETQIMRGVNKNPFILKLDSALNPITFFTQFSGAKEHKIKTIETDNKGNFLVAGEVESVTHNIGLLRFSNQGKKDAFLAKFDSELKLDWAINANPLGEANINHISVDSRNEIFIAGKFKTGFRFGGQPENPIISTCEGEPSRSENGYLVKLSENGEILAAKSVSASGKGDVKGILSDFGNNIYIGGQFEQSYSPDSTIRFETTGGKKNFFLSRTDLNSCRFKYDNSRDFINFDQIYLHQNFPNPTSSGFTYLMFHARSPRKVRMDIFDNKGRHIETVLDEEVEVKNYTIPYTFPPNCENGLYLLRIHSGEFVFTRKMMLMR
ncbi:MAG: T9SS type A sorting domain-containing protein [Cytophagales bacterium]